MASRNVLQFAVYVAGVAIMSQVAKNLGLLDSAGVDAKAIKGFLVFFSGYLLYLPVGLMLGGIQGRDRFFHR